MKYLITLIVGYYAPSILTHVNLDMLLGCFAGLALGLLCALVFVGPTPGKFDNRPRLAVEQAQPQPQRKRTVARKRSQVQYGVEIFNSPQAQYA